MPLYDYACVQCGQTQEVRHGFDEPYAGKCAGCGAPLRRVFNPAPVLFKGSGFYVTDSRRTGSPKTEKAKDEGGAPKSDSSAAPAAKEGSKSSESAA
jgi:putative FmdB family regulatory protein